MKLSKLLLVLAVVLLLMLGCSKEKSTDPTSNIDENVVKHWNLTQYYDEDGLQDMEGYLNIETDLTMQGKFEDTEDMIEVEYSGTVTTSGDKLITDVTESSNEWLEVKSYEWTYTISGSSMTLEGIIDDEYIKLIYTTEEVNHDEFGYLEGTVVSADKGFIENVLIVISNTEFSVHSDSDGKYLIENIPVGTYSVSASKTGFETITQNNIQITKDNTTNLNFEMVENEVPPALGSLSGIVADVMAQTSITGATIMLENTDFSAVSDNNGVYEIDDIPVGNYNVTCHMSGYEDATYAVEIMENDEATVDFMMLPEGTNNYATVSGIISNSNGNPIGNVVAQIEGLANSSLSMDDGSYHIMAIPAGTYNITFTKPGYETYVVQNVTLEEGQDFNLDVTIQQISGVGNLICYVENQMELPVNGALIEILNTSFSATTGLAGMCNIQEIPAGMYNIRVSKAGYTTQEIQNVEILSGLPKTLYVILTN